MLARPVASSLPPVGASCQRMPPNFFSMTIEDIIDFFEEFDIKPEKENQRSFIFNCPSCGGKHKLYIDKSKLIGICFRQKNEECPTPKSGLVKTLALLAGRNIKDVSNWFKSRRGLLSEDVTLAMSEGLPQLESINDDFLHQSTTQKSLTVKKNVWVKPSPITVPDDFLSLGHWMSRAGADYLLKRGVDLAQAISYDVRYSPARSRVIFPIKYEGEWVGYQGRTILANVEPRMYNLPGDWKSNTVMFWDENVRQKRLDHVIIAEGAVSALKLRDLQGFVALMGKIMSQGQWILLNQPYIRSFYLALDADAYEQTVQIADFIRQQRPDVKIYYLPPPKGYEDFGDCPYNVAASAINNKIDLTVDSLPMYEWVLNNS